MSLMVDPKAVELSSQNPNWDQFLESDALALIENSAVTILDSSEATDDEGFPYIEDKYDLVEIPFVILGWKTSSTDRGERVTVRAVTINDRRLFSFGDESTGVKRQLQTIGEKKGDKTKLNEWFFCPIRCMKGLRVSEYDVELENGKKTRAKTYYLA